MTARLPRPLRLHGQARLQVRGGPSLGLWRGAALCPNPTAVSKAWWCSLWGEMLVSLSWGLCPPAPSSWRPPDGPWQAERS